MEDVDLFWIAGTLHGRMPLLSDPARAAVDLALVDMAWKAFIRDAGPADTGPLFSGWQHSDHVLLTEDPRAGAMLSWLASRGGPLHPAASRLELARGGKTISFSAEEHEMLVDAAEALELAGVKLIAAPPVDNLTSAITELRADSRFASAPPGQSSEAGGTWAINLALSTLPTQAPQPGIVQRKALRMDEDRFRTCIREGWTDAVRATYDRVRTVADRLRSTEPILQNLSRNSRARDVSDALAALEMLKRGHISRGWALSNAGTTFVVRQLKNLGVGQMKERGRIDWSVTRSTSRRHRYKKLPSDDAIVELDDAVAFADRLLSKHRASPQT